MLLPKENELLIEQQLQDENIRIGDIRASIKKLRKLTSSPEIEKYMQALLEKERVLRAIYRSKEANFVSIKNGFLAVGGRPGPGKPKLLKEEGTTTIVTLLKTTEKGVEELGEIIKAEGINWIWFPFSAGKSDLVFEEKLMKSVNGLFSEVIKLLENGEKVFIHCAAGIHRTGIITSGLLRRCGFSKEETFNLIKEIRPVTALEAIPRHWKWSEKSVELYIANSESV